MLDIYGVGISHAFGVGGRDLSEAVGGLMTAEALKRLERDPETKAIALVAKHSDEKTVAKLLENVRLFWGEAVQRLEGLRTYRPYTGSS
mgnify:CR=1 FL=1